mgnify:CR=1 FL=1
MNIGLITKTTFKVIRSLTQNVPENGCILDAGCGNFYYANIIKKASRNVICLDIVYPEKDLIQDNAFFLGSVGKLPYKDNTFDFIYCFSVIQFIDDDRAVIDEFYRVLKPGGKLLLTIPTRNSPFKIIRELEVRSGLYKYPQFNISHHHYYSIKDIDKLTSDNFQLEKITGYNYNFIPRLFSFLLGISRQKKGCSKKYSYFSKEKNMKRDEGYSNCNLDRPIRESISNTISGLAYHYIVLLKKSEESVLTSG